MQHTWKLAALATAALLTACGGGGSDAPANRAGLTNVITMGDSLASVGLKAADGSHVAGTLATITGSSNEPTVVWTERVAQGMGIGGTLCSYYNPADTTVTSASCNSYAVSGARINAASTGNAKADSIQKQITEAAANKGSFKATDLILLDGGGNDVADLVGAALQAQAGSPAGFQALLGSLGSASAPALAALAQKDSAQAGGAYLTALANVFAAKIKSDLLDKGASHVAVLNTPDVSKTPRFTALLSGVQARTTAGAKAQGASDAVAAAAGADAAAKARALTSGWVVAYNTALAAALGSDSRIALVDFYTEFNAQIADPAQFDLANVTDTACPATGRDSSGLPSYSFATCTAANLDAIAGKTAGWWQRYAFSDGFHPTPYGHSLMGALVSRTLAQKGWF
ncbi:SGNH/GDSL hydrolase family protein [Amphibiibacter pelophylacis]|uniref:SGNH/GDSL hydrolase family protein n=1 Tax=Amphibiibacter pelophylacis TaxID=1799477 RepID=A0ACC6P1L9_9BURK